MGLASGLSRAIGARVKERRAAGASRLRLLETITPADVDKSLYICYNCNRTLRFVLIPLEKELAMLKSAFVDVKHVESLGYRVLVSSVNGRRHMELYGSCDHNLEDLLKIVEKEFPGVPHSDILLYGGSFDPISVCQRSPSA